MKNKKLAALLGILAITGCQIAPVNATTTIENSDGAGSKTISVLALVDGSIQIEPDTTSFPGNNNYFYIEDSTFENVSFTPKADGAKVKLFHDGYLTNPNGKATCKEVWEEFNTVVESYIPEGFEFKIREVKSSDWDDAYMETVPGAEVKAWKGYVYSVSYSWSNVAEYVSKTKTLIGEEAYAVSHLQELDDAGTPWATLTENSDGTFTWKEAYLVNYWSVYGIADKVTSSTYFNKAALGAEFAITTDQTFAIALQEYKMGDGDSVIVKIDNSNGLDADLNPKFIEVTGTLPKLAKKTKSNVGVIVGCVIAGVAVIGLAAFFVLRKKA